MNLLAVATEEHGGEVDLGGLILHHVADSQLWSSLFGVVELPAALAWSKMVLMMVVAATLVFIGVRRAVKGYDEYGVPRTRWAQMVDPFVEHFYRDVALPHAGRKWASRVAPLLLNFFFFILTCNLLGLVPISDSIRLGAHFLPQVFGPIEFVAEGGATATGNFNVTGALALISFVAIILFGIGQHGVVGHFAHLAPKGAPFIVRWFLLLPIETLSMFVKPFALTMRLAGNMTAGHMGILALMLGFIYAAQTADLAGSVGGFPAAVIATGIMLLEIIVAFVQAYVFALLSGVFIGMAVHHH
jgi:F-type H+-transporting ATPase subunit a